MEKKKRVGVGDHVLIEGGSKGRGEGGGRGDPRPSGLADTQVIYHLTPTRACGMSVK